MKLCESQNEHRHFPKSAWKALAAMLLRSGEHTENVVCRHCGKQICPKAEIPRPIMGILVLTTALLLYAGLFILLGGHEGAFTGFVFYLFVRHVCC